MSPSSTRLPFAAALVVAGIGSLVVTGWILGIPWLFTYGLDGYTSKVNTGLALLLVGSALALISRSTPGRPAARLGAVLGGLAAVIAVLTLGQRLFGVDLGLDELLVFDRSSAAGHTPGRMAPNTALALLAAAIPLVIEGCNRNPRRRPYELVIGGVALLLLALLSLVGHLVQIPAGRQWTASSGMSLPSTLAFLVLGTSFGKLAFGRAIIRWHLTIRQTGTLVAGVLVLVTASTLGWESALRLEANNRELVRASNARFLISELLASAHEIEGGFRRTFVTGQIGSSEVIDGMLTELDRRLGELRDLLKPEADVSALVGLRTTLSELAAFERRLIALQQSGGIGLVGERLRTGEGARLLDAARRQLESMQMFQTAEIDRLETESSRWRRTAALVTVIGSGVAVLFIGLALFSLNTEVGRRRTSETRFRGIFESSFHFVGLLDVRGTLLEANQVALDFAGVKLADVVGRPFWETTWWSGSADGRERIQAAIREAATGRTVRYETVNYGRDGRAITVEFSLRPVRGADGEISYLVPEGRDITGFIEAKQAVADHEERWNFALSGSDLGVWDWNLQTNEVYFSERWITMLGHQRNEITHRLDEWSSRVHPDDLAPTLDLIRGHVEGRTSFYRSEHRLRAKDGSWRWILDQGKIVARDAEGRPIRMIGTHADITDRKEAERGRAELQARLSGIVDFNPTLISLIDREGRYQLVSPRAATELGRPIEEIIGRTFEELLPQPVARRFRERIEQMNRHPAPFVVEDEMPGPHGPRTFVTHLFPIHDATGTHVATGGIASDVTAERSTLQQVQHALAERDVLLREVHHRVKNNLQIVSSLLSLQARTLTDPALRAPFEDSRQRIASMALIHDRLYRHDDLAQIDLHRHVGDLVRLQRHAFGDSAGRIDVRVDIATPPVDVATAVPCSLIISELFANACKHAFPLGREGRIEISMTATAECWTLQVSDNGIGATSTTGGPASAGIGLQLVQALARQLGGELTESATLEGRRTVIQFAPPVRTPSSS